MDAANDGAAGRNCGHRVCRVEHLLLDGKCPNDEQIVFEHARIGTRKVENRTPEVLRRGAMVEGSSVVPEGKGKRVADKLN